MIPLKELFNLMATGEFSNIALSRTDTGSLHEQDYEKVIGHLNLGILEIYKRFKFLQNELTLHTDPRVNKYYLRTDRVAASHNMNLNTYIAEPEDEEGCLNIIEVTGVFNSAGDEYKMNNRFLTPSIVQMAPDILRIKGLETPEILTVAYQACPTEILLDDDFELEDVVVQIPKTILEALLYYVASRVYKPTGSNESTQNADKSASYQQQYELACQKLALYGLDTQDDDEPDNFTERGWA